MGKAVLGKNDVFRKQILSEIAIGIYREGERLPGERELSERYQVSRNTVRRALQELEHDGVLLRRAPVGTFVAGDALTKLRANRAAEFRVAVLMNNEEANNPIYRQIFHSMQSHLPDEVRLNVYFCGSCGGLFLAGERIELALVFGHYPEAELETLRTRVGEVVVWGRESETFSCISCDNYTGGRLMAQTAIDAGHRHIALIGPREEDARGEFARRIAGVEDACRESGVSLLFHRLTLEESFNLAGSIYFTLDGFLREEPELSVVLCLYDSIALSVLECCRLRGIPVPERLSVIGFDDHCYAEFITPALTTVRNVAEEAGVRLANHIESRLHDPAGSAGFREVLKPFLIERETLRRLPGRNGVGAGDGIRTRMVF